MSQYAGIDPILSRWAQLNSVVWFTDHHDTEVRTFFLNPDKRGRVQVFVEPPHDGRTTVHVAQFPNGISRLHREERFICSASELPNALDNALKIAGEWVAAERV